MIRAIALELGPWTWWILGLVFLGLEILVPGVFLLWIGLAALALGALSLMMWDMAIWGWQLQLLVFAVLSIGFVIIGRRVSNAAGESDQPMLNRRTESLVGRTATLEEPITEGQGRIRLDDTTWIVRGPELPAGTRVRIVTAQSGSLTVEPA
ncbi:NfeD family protein [Hoeflea sp.]|uniref:NfeD family protein n=1 Tax=Hoeflea sp. TaxID=1940281 RepID=UPI003B51B13F